MQELDTHFSRSPEIASSAFIAPTADIMGAVTIGERSSIWYQCVLRGDINSIRIGCESNIQDGTIIHVSSAQPAIVGDRVSCGHRAIIHACMIHDEVLIGMGAVVMDGAIVGSGTIVGAGTLIPMGTEIPTGVLVLGSPARVIRDLEPSERDSIPALAAKYRTVSAAHVRRRSSEQTG